MLRHPAEAIVAGLHATQAGEREMHRIEPQVAVRGTLQHASYPGIRNTAGNMAYPFSPFGVPLGPAYRFAVYHLMPLADPCECFPMTIEEVKN